MDKHNLVFIVFDSCRFDTFAAAKTPNISRLGETQRCYSFASWTLPAHHVYMMGASPHTSPKGVFASEVYKKDFVNWGQRLNIPDISFRGFVPKLSLPAFLKSQGYQTHALVSMPVLNPTTVLNNHFDRFELMKSHNDFNAIIDQMYFEQGQPTFYLLNLGETHYPYTLPGESSGDLPIIHGAHGVFKHLDDLVVEGSDKSAGSFKTNQEKLTPEQFFNMDLLLGLKEKQRKNVEYLDGLFEKLYEKLPATTHVMVLSDHGECFGEEGYFGHGPVFHEKVFEVFMVEGKIK